jgi:hypothetical protein
MPQNSVVHADRIAKVKQGFTAAKLTTLQVKQIMGVFDVITESNAREVAQRTEFSVSSASKASESLFGSGKTEERRQMARALAFVGDLQKLYDDEPLPKKRTDSEFETLWRGDFAALASKLTAAAQGLYEQDVKLREILNTPVIASPRPAPRRIVIPDETLALFNDSVTRRGNRREELKQGFGAFHTLKTGWSDSKTALIANFVTAVNASTRNLAAVQTAAELAYTEFEGFFREVGKENEAKIAMAKSLFSALASHAPFPLSIVGKIGSAAVGVLHADTAIAQERALGPPKYFDTNVPTLVKFNEKLGAIKSWTADLTRLGVASGAMPSGTSIRTAIDTASSTTASLLNKVFVDAINETYGASPGEQADKSTAFFRMVQDGLGGEDGGARPELVAQLALRKLDVLLNVTKSAIASAGTSTIVNASEIQPFIELQLLAEYLAVLIPDENFTKAIPEGLIRRLESPPFDIVRRKTGSSQTDKIYELKKLPWVTGHPRHVGALVYFFRWYKRSVNPFDLATGKVTSKGIWDAMGVAIGEIGTAVQAHKVKRTLRSADTADWTKVARDVVKIRGV